MSNSLLSNDSLEEFEYLYNDIMAEKAKERHPDMTINLNTA